MRKQKQKIQKRKQKHILATFFNFLIILALNVHNNCQNNHIMLNFDKIIENKSKTIVMKNKMNKQNQIN